MTDRIKAVALISGGLDSLLAARLIQDQGIEVIGVSCRHPFHAPGAPGEKPYPMRVAEQLGIELVRPDVSAELIALAQDPPHGHGKHLNPCIDCRLLYLQKGKELMEERGARFLITGEVLGQRPMSQRKDTLNVILRDSGMKGLILRPLSARLLAPTIPETEGWVDREKLEAVSGRGRKPQMELAARYGFTDYSAPAGGCLLTMEDFVRKVRELFAHEPLVKPHDIELLKRGRHFRLAPGLRLVVGKDDRENLALEAMARPGDLTIITPETPGPLGLLRGVAGPGEIRTAMAIMGRYIKRGAGEPLYEVRDGQGKLLLSETTAAMSERDVDDFRI